MAPRRRSRLQRHILKCLMAAYRWTPGGPLLGHYELVATLGRDTSNIGHSLRTLEARGLMVINRTLAGQAHAGNLTSEGRKEGSEMEESCD